MHNVTTLKLPKVGGGTLAPSAPAKPTKPPVDRHRLASEIFANFTTRYGNTSPTPSEGDQLAKAAYAYADRFIVAMEERA